MPKFKLNNVRDCNSLIDYIRKVSENLLKNPNGKKYDADIKMRRKKHSNDHRKLYFMWVGVIADSFRCSRESVHENLKDMFLPLVSYEAFGRKASVRKSIADLDSKELTRFTDEIKHWAIGEDIVLPEPDDLMYSQMEERYS